MANDIVVRDTFDVGEYKGPTGFEDFGAEDVSMSWLRIAAKNTDAAIKDSPDYVDGLEPGFFFKTGGEKKTYGKSVQLIVLKYFKSYTEIDPKKNEFKRSVSSREVSTLTRVGANYPLPSGNVVKEAFNYLVLLPNDPASGILRFSLGAGSFRHIKNFNAMITGANAPIWAPVWELSTTLAKSKDGDSYYTIGNENTLVKRIGFIDPSIKDDVIAAFEVARQFDPDHGASEDTPF